ncbi:MAG: nucleotidyltransferase domain-containing protein [Clostridiales bacterium]|jgi:predicted nucleotidyltransferase|nr:nucleotidyltransferase domain-containing protein [Clostridiales bacterium]
MHDSKKKLEIFLADFEYKNDVVGVLACGSFVTGNPTKHSDLDVHIVLDENVNYRERGNKYIDGLQDARELQKPEFDFMYFSLLNRLIEKYMYCINRPYNIKAIYGNIENDTVRKKYLLRELPDPVIADLIIKAITAKENKVEAFKKLTTAVLNSFGGFNIDGFKFKSDVEKSLQ